MNTKNGVVVRDIWSAAAVAYFGYELYRIELDGVKDTEFYFAGPQCDIEIVLEDYQKSRLALSDAKHFSLGFTRLNTQVKQMRFRRDYSWVSPTWIEGKV
jgi:hypothetical protein